MPRIGAPLSWVLVANRCQTSALPLGRPFLPSVFAGWVATTESESSRPYVPGRHTVVLSASRWIPFAYVSRRVLASVSWVPLLCKFLCFVFGTVFGLRKVHLEVLPPHLIFWKPLWKHGVHSSLNIWCNSSTPTGPGYLFIGSFKITDSISFIVLGIFKLSVAQGRFVVVCVFSIHLVLSCQIYVCGVVRNGLSSAFGCLQGL